MPKLKMYKTYLTLGIMCCSLSCCFLACKKDADNTTTTDNTLIISVNSLIGMAGQNWSGIQPQLQSKRGYWYTEFTTDQSSYYKAAVSMPAYDTTNGLKTVCHLLMNVDRQTSKLFIINMNTDDTLSPMSKEQAFTFALNYYNAGLKSLLDTTHTYSWYDDGTGYQVPTTVADIITKLKTNFNTSFLGMEYYRTGPRLELSASKNVYNDRYAAYFLTTGY